MNIVQETRPRVSAKPLRLNSCECFDMVQRLVVPRLSLVEELQNFQICINHILFRGGSAGKDDEFFGNLLCTKWLHSDVWELIK